MATRHKPLFNPLYLRALILILPVLIILLASLGPDDVDYPAIHNDGAHRLAWIEQPQSPANELRLLLPTSLALNPERRIMQQTLATLLQQRLQQPTLRSLLEPLQDSSVLPGSDHLQISLRWPAGGGLPALNAILRALRQAPEPATVTSTLARTRAQAYLEGQQPEQRLLNQLQQQLQPGAGTPISTADVVRQFQQLLDRPPMLILGGPDAAQLADHLIATAPAQITETGKAGSSRRVGSYNDTPVQLAPVASSSQPTRLQLSDARLPAMYLLGARMAGRGTDDYAAELLTISSLQRALALRPDETGSYRLVWQPSRGSGYRALIMDGQPTASRAGTLDAAVINDSLIDTARQQLLSQLRDRMQTPEGQLDQLATLALNNLTGQRLDSILDQLKAVPGDDIGPRIAHYLAPDTQVLITLNGQSD